MKKKLVKRISAVVFVATLYALLAVAEANQKWLTFGESMAAAAVLMLILFGSAYIGGAFDDN